MKKASRLTWFHAAALFAVSALALWAFWPSLGNAFVDWDDYINLRDNPNFRSFGSASLRWMATAFHGGHYIPLTWLSFAFDHAVWGMNPFGYHLTNVLLHAANAGLAYWLFWRLLPAGETGRRVLAAAAGALLFALHPLRVESVAWVTERRDLLSGFFYISSVACYLQAAGAPPRQRRWWSAAAMGGAVFCCLSKAIGMTLPAVFLALDHWPLRRWDGRRFLPALAALLREKAFYVGLALATAFLAAKAQAHSQAVLTWQTHGVLERLAQMSYGAVFYAAKTLAPVGLYTAHLFPAPFNPLSPVYVLCFAALLAATVVFFRERNRCAPLWTAWAVYLALFLPTSGVLQSGNQFVADRYTYLATLPFAALAAGGLFFLFQSRARGGAAAAVIALLLGLGALSRRQCLFWRDSETLWRRTLAMEPGSYMAHSNLAAGAMDRNDLAEARRHAELAIQRMPLFDPPWLTLANVLAKENRRDAAKRVLESLLATRNSVGAYFLLAKWHIEDGAIDAAGPLLQRAVNLNPNHPEILTQWGYALTQKERLADAETALRRAVAVSPWDPAANNTLSVVLLKRGFLDEALRAAKRAAAVQPDHAAFNNMGSVYLKMGRWEDAHRAFLRAIAADPSRPEAYVNAGALLAEAGRYDEALKMIDRALAADPRYAPALTLRPRVAGDLRRAAASPKKKETPREK